MNKKTSMIKKITLVYKRPWTFVSKQTGETFSGFTYGGFLNTGKTITFTSQMDHEGKILVSDTPSYDDDYAIDVDLEQGWDEARGKLKWAEKKVDQAPSSEGLEN
jgi:hypothetical protein